MPKSIRHQRMAGRAARPAVERREYEIVDKSHRPDLRGEFAGVKVARRGTRQFVTLSAQQAKFYLDQGVLRAAPGVAHEKPIEARKPTTPLRAVTAQPMRYRS